MQSAEVPGTRNSRTILFGVLAALILLVIGTTSLVLKQLHDATEMRFKSAARVLSKSVVQTLDTQIESIDYVLADMAKEIGVRLPMDGRNSKHLHKLFAEQKKRLRHVAYLHATNAQGRVVMGGGRKPIMFNLADREYFRQLKDHPDKGMFIAHPVQSRLDKEWIWVFARRIERPGGKFYGIVFAVIKVETVNRIFSRLSMQAGNIISLYCREMRLIARHVPPSQFYSPSESVGASPLLLASLRMHPLEGSYVSKASPVDGIGRIHSYQRSENYGFLINVGISRENAFALWRQQAWITGVVAIVMVVMLAVLARLVLGGWKRQEQHLAEIEASRNLLSEAQRIASISSYRYDLRTDQWSGTGAIRNILGMPDDFPNDSNGWFSLIEPPYAQTMQSRLAMAMEQGRSFSEEYPVTSLRDGRRRWLHQRATVEVDADGKPSFIFGTLQDITERKAAEEALRDSHETLESILQTTLDGVWRLNMAGRILDVNQKLCEMSGYSRDELLSMHVSDLEDVETSSDTASRLLSIARHGHAQYESRHRRKDGTTYDIEVSATYRSHAEGQVVAFMRDISERKLMEQQMRQLVTQDELTGAYNRRHFMHLAEIEHRRALRLEQDLAVVMIDIDWFKQTNDRDGHAAGDRALRLLAEVFLANIRQIDVFARLGGDEFVLLLPGSNAQLAVEVVERCREALSSGQKAFADIVTPITISVGIASIESDDDRMEDVMSRADRALYEAKQMGRNRTHLV